MDDVILSIENVSKQYQLGTFGTGTFGGDLKRWWYQVRGKEDPFLKLGEVNDRTSKESAEYVWALKNINLEVNAGEMLGIIGRNGAGKSTLLKLLSRVTRPTTGSIRSKGRMASLLEVGTGFHPELTGRENIFLNGAILGMTKGEIKNKLDEIIDFSGCSLYIDTPVKRYSSGMKVRLGFAVAAFLEPDILVVDEVLAVGDAEFQKKAIGKMQDVSQGNGRTVLFVSHNMASIRSLCSRVVLMNNGEIQAVGDTNEIISNYLNNDKANLKEVFSKSTRNGTDIELVEASLQDGSGKVCNIFEISDDIEISLGIHCLQKVPNLQGYIVVKDNQDQSIIESDTFDFKPNSMEHIVEGINRFSLKIPKFLLSVGEYTIYLSFTSNLGNSFIIDVPGNILYFSIVDNITRRGARRKALTGHIVKWELINAE